MGSFEENYDEDVLRTFTDQQQARLRRLHKLFDDKFDEIAALLAEQLQVADAVEQASDAIDQWEEGQMEESPPEPRNDLDHLLHEHHKIGEEIMNIREEAS